MILYLFIQFFQVIDNPEVQLLCGYTAGPAVRASCKRRCILLVEHPNRYNVLDQYAMSYNNDFLHSMVVCMTLSQIIICIKILYTS